MRPGPPYVARGSEKFKVVLARPQPVADCNPVTYSFRHGEHADSPSDGFRPSSAQLSFCREDCAWTGRIPYNQQLALRVIWTLRRLMARPAAAHATDLAFEGEGNAGRTAQRRNRCVLFYQ